MRRKKFAARTAKFVSSFYLGIAIVHRLSAVFFGVKCAPFALKPLLNISADIVT